MKTGASVSTRLLSTRKIASSFLHAFVHNLTESRRTMTVTLTHEQSRQLSEAANPLTYAVDPASRRRDVLLGSDVFERVRMIVGEANLQDVFTSCYGADEYPG